VRRRRRSFVGGLALLLGGAIVLAQSDDVADAKALDLETVMG
jgi:hypothetical protein